MPLIGLPGMGERNLYIGHSHADADQQRSFFSHLGKERIDEMDATLASLVYLCSNNIPA
jgi:hypothetical protein